MKISPETEPLDEPSITAAMFGFLEAALQQHQITQWVRHGRILLGPVLRNLRNRRDTNGKPHGKLAKTTISHGLGGLEPHDPHDFVARTGKIAIA